MAWIRYLLSLQIVIYIPKKVEKDNFSLHEIQFFFTSHSTYVLILLGYVFAV